MSLTQPFTSLPMGDDDALVLKRKAKEEEDCLDWDEVEEDVVSQGRYSSDGRSERNGENRETSNQGLCVAVCTLISAIPAVIGSWCWPILVGSMLSVAAQNVPPHLVELFHGIQVAVTLTLMTNIIQFAWWTCKKRRKQMGMTHWKCYWSVYLLTFATCLVMVQPSSMLVIGSFKLKNWFFDGGKDTGALVPNTTIGWLIQIFCTYLGYLCMFVGVFGATKLHLKIQKKWRQIRRGG